MGKQRARRITLLDDSATVRAMLVSVLESAGYEAEACASWDELKQTLRVGMPDLVLLDVEMPEIVGEHIGFGLKRDHPALRVVFLSDNDSETLAALCAQTGVDGYIRKTSDLDELLESIAAQLPEP